MAKTNKLEETLKRINKKYGDGAIYKFGDGDGLPTVYIPTGSIGLDNILGGGIVQGRMVEIFGPESSGKSSTALHIMAEAQKMGMVCAYVDGEHSFDEKYAKAIGVNVDEMYYIEPFNLEDSLEITRELAEAGMFIIYDSTNSLPLRAETDDDSEIGSHHVGREGKIFSQACRMINPLLTKHNSTIIWLSQLRANIGGFGNAPKDVIGRGNALKFYVTTRINCRRTSSGKQQGKKISNIVKMVVVKNKKGIQFAETTVEILYGKGYNKVGEIVEIGVEHGLVDKRGAWFKYVDSDGVLLASGQGKINFEKDLISKPEMLERLRLSVVKAVNKEEE